MCWDAPGAGDAAAVVAYLSLGVDLTLADGAPGGPQHETINLTVAPALHASNLTPWPLRLRALGAFSCPDPNPDPVSDTCPGTIYLVPPRTTLALPVLWTAHVAAVRPGAHAAPILGQRASTAAQGGNVCSYGPAVEVSMAQPDASCGASAVADAELASNAGAREDAVATDGARPANMRPPAGPFATAPFPATTPARSAMLSSPGTATGATAGAGQAAAEGAAPAAALVPLLGAGAGFGRRTRLYLSGAAAVHGGMDSGTGGDNAAAMVTYRLLAPAGRVHLVMFQDAQPPLVLRNATSIALQVCALSPSQD